MLTRRHAAAACRSRGAEDLPQISLYVPEQISLVDDKKFQGFTCTPDSQPCGVTGDTRHLHWGSTDPAPKN